MKKTIIIISFSLAAFSLIILFYNNHRASEPFRCDTQVISKIAIKGRENLFLNLHVNIVLTTPEKGELIIVGSIKGSEVKYNVTRNLLLHINTSELNSIHRITIMKQTIHPIDNVPEELWQKYIMPERDGVAFYVEIKKLRENTFIFKGIPNPYFVCARHSN